MLSKPGAPNTNKHMYGVQRTSQQWRIQTQRKMRATVDINLGHFLVVTFPTVMIAI
ncbi:hypothetical protein L13192_03093 [Pyrenophora tritici-repentis]|uniref:Uncharacterized protein n=1 Tax=Pyrenophora tritici-repentis TaxID=45151 RepID=A0A922NMZ1_9PLEO|nr:hypothetical protein Ptr86124_001798 [Pyrenophora tritici-repentis]KAI1672234.1 hypothetical protein L13192_03093 [Pyrenophora tritici-repentis]KAI1686247.1 hypothetical protein KJE20_04212 [Pyrenophora tritici-repentis]